MINKQESILLTIVSTGFMWVTLLGFGLIGLAAVTALVQHAVCHN